MPILIDLSHTLEPDMSHFHSFDAPHIGALWTHAEAAERGYQDTSCEVTEVRFVTSIGTYLDAPYHFDPQGVDVSQLDLSQLVLPGVVLDLRDQAAPGAPLPPDALDGLDVTGKPFDEAQSKAVLLYTGWSDFWGEEHYYPPLCAPRALAERLRDLQPALVGVDTLMIENRKTLPGQRTRCCCTLDCSL